MSPREMMTLPKAELESLLTTLEETVAAQRAMFADVRRLQEAFDRFLPLLERLADAGERLTDAGGAE